MKENSKIPPHWQIKKLGEVCDVLDNLRKPINSDERKKRISGKAENELYSYYGATGQVGWIDDYITDGEYILVGEDGAPFLDIFKEKAYKIKGKTWVNNHAHILKGKERMLSNDFVLYYLNSINYIDYVNGTTRLKLTKSSLMDIDFILPPLPEQHLIVSKIEELFSELDKGVENLKTAQQQLKVYRQSLLKAAFEGKLTNKYVKEGELPEGWKWVKVGDICKCIVPNRDKPKTFTGDIKWVTTPNLKQNSISLDYNNIALGLTEEEALQYNARVIPTGSVVMTCVGTFGLSAVVQKPIVINQQLHAFISNELINSKYLAYCIQNNKHFFEKKSTSTTIQYLNKENCNSMPLPLCKIEEQNQIVQILESKLTICDKIEETIAQSLQQAETLRQSILKKAFEGELVEYVIEN
ncbi:MAG: restriction endonuclease subunit S [Bacteroidota bacterium]